MKVASTSETKILILNPWLTINRTTLAVIMDFTLRPWTLDDLDNLVKFANNQAIAKNMTDQFPHPYTADNGRAFIEFATKDSPIHVFAIDLRGTAIGGIGIHPQSDIQRRNAELGYWLAEPFWGKGIMTQAVPLMIDFAFKTYDITRIYARPFGTNVGSQRVLEKTGFKLEARFERSLFKNGEYLDELVYAIRKKTEP
jgi:ribosomal-protein-alanine N-acetyltransferase